MKDKTDREFSIFGDSFVQEHACTYPKHISCFQWDNPFMDAKITKPPSTHVCSMDGSSRLRSQKDDQIQLLVTPDNPGQRPRRRRVGCSAFASSTTSMEIGPPTIQMIRESGNAGLYQNKRKPTPLFCIYSIK